MSSIATKRSIEELQKRVNELEGLVDELLQLMNGPDETFPELRKVQFPKALRKLGYVPPERPLKPGEKRADVPDAPAGSMIRGIPVGGGKFQ